MTIQELKDFLEIVEPDLDAKVLVRVDGRARTPRIEYSAKNGRLVLDVPTRSKQAPSKRKRKTR